VSFPDVAETNATEQDLAWALALIDALMAVALLADNETTRSARRNALERFEHLSHSAAVVERFGAIMVRMSAVVAPARASSRGLGFGRRRSSATYSSLA
jgi:hypothetical protein